jgi:hypothetical protein
MAELPFDPDVEMFFATCAHGRPEKTQTRMRIRGLKPVNLTQRFCLANWRTTTIRPKEIALALAGLPMVG